jgi:hypothetical protein
MHSRSSNLSAAFSKLAQKPKEPSTRPEIEGPNKCFQLGCGAGPGCKPAAPWLNLLSSLSSEAAPQTGEAYPAV